MHRALVLFQSSPEALTAIPVPSLSEHVALSGQLLRDDEAGWTVSHTSSENVTYPICCLMGPGRKFLSSSN
ncbi:uncharacterized protein BO96DRAFT_410109 [Aspergillus niger CBS 101883]|uniref:Uncharacterized protein n=1 Tax=Aspergillus phoenicis ATCC 13157 TaxID=1353007 RepID=A0A370Q099_ASPPH|nr:uncharacterized protein BO96DRAFT_410109 [Aspergillus niger CBS 101883]PYH58844.1 hypothetical protein BO96DRAFT_410109 [Aspergillus niger CBS 101883]RDK47863.1 hypothetical protein M752DRAFT_272099 [Aspergillus phoenicis ATCC 13157]